MADIYLRDIDEEIKHKLKMQAKRKGVSLNSYIKALLTSYCLKGEVINLDDKYRNLFKDMTSLYQSLVEKTSLVIEENSHVLNQIIEGEDDE